MRGQLAVAEEALGRARSEVERLKEEAAATAARWAVLCFFVRKNAAAAAAAAASAAAAARETRRSDLPSGTRIHLLPFRYQQAQCHRPGAARGGAGARRAGDCHPGVCSV